MPMGVGVSQNNKHDNDDSFSLANLTLHEQSSQSSAIAQSLHAQDVLSPDFDDSFSQADSVKSLNNRMPRMSATRISLMKEILETQPSLGKCRRHSTRWSARRNSQNYPTKAPVQFEEFQLTAMSSGSTTQDTFSSWDSLISNHSISYHMEHKKNRRRQSGRRSQNERFSGTGRLSQNGALSAISDNPSGRRSSLKSEITLHFPGDGDKGERRVSLASSAKRISIQFTKPGCIIDLVDTEILEEEEEISVSSFSLTAKDSLIRSFLPQRNK